VTIVPSAQGIIARMDRATERPRRSMQEGGEMGLLLRPNRPLLRLAVGAASSRSVRSADAHPAERLAENGGGAAVGRRPAAGRATASDPAEWATTMHSLMRLSRLHEAGELTDDGFTTAIGRLLGLRSG
jgi:hypothetical protein